MTSGSSARAGRSSTQEKAAALRAEAARRERRRHALVRGGVIAVVLALVVGVGIAIQANRTTTATADKATPANLVDGGIPAGQASAKVRVDVYEDFQCPICKQFEATSGATLAKYVADGTARVVYHPIAILDRASSTRYSTRAAAAAGCVADTAPSAFVPWHAAVYAEQPPEGGAGISDARLAELAKAHGASAAASCITGSAFESWATRVTDAASQAGVTGTPTVLVNGQVLQDWTPAGLSAAVAAAK